MPPPATFDADWLALREPTDHLSRAAALIPVLQAAWRSRRWSRILDLGSGTGSNLRYLGPRLSGPQDWTLLDHDPDLLAQAGASPFVRIVNRVSGDLAAQGLAEVRDAHIVTGAALLDLVSKDWLRRLAKACRSSSSGAYFALTYNGEIQWSVGEGHGVQDEDPDDTLIRQAVNAHQRGDKGLGPALGPMASQVAQAFFQAAGYRTWLMPSAWRLGAADAELARVLIDGWERAALELEARQADDLADHARRVRVWAERRRQTIDSGDFVLTVGHMDLLALPIEKGS